MRQKIGRDKERERERRKSIIYCETDNNQFDEHLIPTIKISDIFMKKKKRYIVIFVNMILSFLIFQFIVWKLITPSTTQMTRYV